MIIDYIGISDKAKKIKDHFRCAGKTMTPEKVCALKSISIELIEMDIDISTEIYKANYTYLKRQHIVQYNKRINIYRNVVLYHEIGHRVLHWKLAGFTFHLDSDVCGVHSTYEVEANVFSAEMALDDEDVLDCLFDRSLTFFQAAKALCVPDEIFYYKCRILQERGYKISIPVTVTGDFMKGKDY